MTICPVALVVGCRKCLAFNLCPAKGIIGDFKKESSDQAARGKAGDASKNGEKK